MPKVKRLKRERINKNYYQKNQETLNKKSQEYYQQNKEQLKEKRRIKRQKLKEINERGERERLDRYYGAESIKILMSLKDYTEIDARARKLWLNFVWTLKDTKEGIHDIVQVMKLCEEGEKLIKDYWRTAREEAKVRWERQWNNLDYDQRQQLIKYWGQEKARKEKRLVEEFEWLNERGNSYEKEIEAAKFHEERGKKGCQCWYCEQQAEIRKEVEKGWKEELRKEEEKERKELGAEKIDCNNCGRSVNYKSWDDEMDMCKRCVREQDE